MILLSLTQEYQQLKLSKIFQVWPPNFDNVTSFAKSNFLYNSRFLKYYLVIPFAILSFLIWLHLVAFIFIWLIFLRGLLSRVYDLLIYNTQQTDHRLHSTLYTIIIFKFE